MSVIVWTHTQNDACKRTLAKNIPLAGPFSLQNDPYRQHIHCDVQTEVSLPPSCTHTDIHTHTHPDNISPVHNLLELQTQ